MSFFSNLILAANQDVKVPTPAEMEEVLELAGLLRPLELRRPSFNLSDDITALFNDEEARQKNDCFFTPDAVGSYEGIHIQSPEEEYEGEGFSIGIAGYGYFFPWSNADLRERILPHPKLIKLAELAQSRFGGRFEQPDEQTISGPTPSSP